ELCAGFIYLLHTNSGVSPTTAVMAVSGEAQRGRLSDSMGTVRRFSACAPLLNGRADRPVRPEHAAITGPRPKDCAASAAGIRDSASIHRHALDTLMSACRTGNERFFYHATSRRIDFTANDRSEDRPNSTIHTLIS